MKKAAIWDLDGTLFDSYDMIVDSIMTVFRENSIEMSIDEIRNHALQFSIQSLFRMVSDGCGITVEELNRRYGEVSRGKWLHIKPMPCAKETLERLRLQGVEQYVFTHRGKTTVPVLENLDMLKYFSEILTSQSGFPRKPDPQALRYLIKQYDLDPQTTYYIGDRSLDMECAANAGIVGILYCPQNTASLSSGVETFRVQSLRDVLDLI